MSRVELRKNGSPLHPSRDSWLLPAAVGLGSEMPPRRGKAAAAAADKAVAVSALPPDKDSKALGQLLERVATKVPGVVLAGMLRSLPGVEVARLACVHKVFWTALKTLRRENPGRLYDPPTEGQLKRAQGYSRLVRASAFGDVAVLQSMVAAGVDERRKPLVQAREKGGVRTLDEALRQAVLGSHVRAVELLLDAGADMQLGAEFGDDDSVWKLALSIAGVEEVAALLVQRCDPDDHIPHDALFVSCEIGWLNVVKLLLDRGWDLHADADMALSCAASEGHPDVLALLLERGANVNAGNGRALRWACRSGRMDIVITLIQHGANVRLCDNRPIREASRAGHAAMVQLLLQHGADPGAVEKKLDHMILLSEEDDDYEEDDGDDGWGDGDGDDGDEGGAFDEDDEEE
jgi:ankyrin repeat protein